MTTPEGTITASSPANMLGKRWLRGTAVALVVVAALIFVATQSFVTRWAFTRLASSELGVPVRASAVRIGIGGTVRVRGLRVLTPGLSGPEAEFLRADTLDAVIDFSAWRNAGASPFSKLVVSGLVARVSQSLDGASTNVPMLRTGGAAAPRALPTVDVRGGRVEFGEHRPGSAGGLAPIPRYASLKELPVQGDLTPDRLPGSYVVRLVSSPPPGSPRRTPLAIEGRFDAAGVNLTLAGLSLREFSPSSAPSHMRELVSAMNLAGDVRSLSFSYAYPREGAPGPQWAGVHSVLELSDVAVTLPFDSREPGPDGSPVRPRMTRTSGQIRFRGGELTADLTGMIEDLPYTVSMRWAGPTLDSAFEATLVTRGFQMRERPALTPFIPSGVRERLAMFSNPTGMVDSEVTLSRGAPSDGRPAPVRVVGSMDIREAVASFVRFPYEFRGMSGRFEFDDESITIVGVWGTAANGATIDCRGRIAPLTDEAAVELFIRCERVPIDSALENGLGESRREIIGALFNAERLEALRGEGLVVSAEEHAQRQKELDDARARARSDPSPQAAEELDLAERRAAVPEFTLGGVGEVEIHLSTPFGKDAPWSERIRVSLPRAGLLPEKFPYPIRASDIILNIDDGALELAGGEFSGLRGGTASVEARADFSSKGAGNTEVSITASGVPLDRTLLFALPAGDDAISDDPRALTPKQALAALAIEGAADAEVWVGDGDDGELGFRALVEFTHLSASPRLPGTPAEAPALGLSDMMGRMLVDDLGLSMELSARVWRTEPDTPPQPACRVQAAAYADFQPRALAEDPAATGRRPPRAYDISVIANDVDVRAPVERLLELFAPGAADTLARIRTQYNPAGSLDVAAHAFGGADRPASLLLSLGTQAGVEVDHTSMGRTHRLGLGRSEGLLTVVRDKGIVLRFEGFRSAASVDGQPAGDLTLDGDIRLSPRREFDLRASLTDGRFESPLPAIALAEALGPESASTYATYQPIGRFNVQADVKGPQEGRAPGAAEAVGRHLAASLTPRTLSVLAGDARTEFSQVGGSLRVFNGRGEFDGLRVATPEWSVGVQGAWKSLEGDASAVHLDLDVRSRALPKDLRALLPEGLRDLFDDLSLDVAGSVEIPRLEIALGVAPGGTSRTVRGVASVVGASAELGAAITEGDGTIRFTTERSAEGVVTFDVTADFERARAAGLALTAARVRAANGPRPRETLIPLIDAQCHGGKLSGEASLRPSGSAEDAPLLYEARLDLSGVLLHAAIDDLSSASRSTRPQTDTARLDAGVTLAGEVGNPASRRGRGLGYAGGGPVLSLPILLPLIQVSNFQPPTGKELDTAKASFFIEGSTVAFERISVFSPSVELRGFGLLTWPDGELNMVFNSRSALRVPVVTPLLEGFRNELLTTVLRGTLREPSASVMSLRGVRSALGTMFGGRADEAQRFLDDMERESARNADRIRATPR